MARSQATGAKGERPWRHSLWSAGIGLLGTNHVLWRIGLFFSRLAVVTFGGAYAVLAYMAQQAVSTQHWLSTSEMADGLGLAETTPGPLIMVTQLVGYLAAPCFLWVFTPS